MLRDGDVDFAFVSYMEYVETTPGEWHNVPSFDVSVHPLRFRISSEAKELAFPHFTMSRSDWIEVAAPCRSFSSLRRVMMDPWSKPYGL